MLRSAHDHREVKWPQKLAMQKSRGRVVRHAPTSSSRSGPFPDSRLAHQNHVIIVRASKYVEHLLDLHGPSNERKQPFFSAPCASDTGWKSDRSTTLLARSRSPSRVCQLFRMADRRTPCSFRIARRIDISSRNKPTTRWGPDVACGRAVRLLPRHSPARADSHCSAQVD